MALDILPFTASRLYPPHIKSSVPRCRLAVTFTQLLDDVAINSCKNSVNDPRLGYRTSNYVRRKDCRNSSAVMLRAFDSITTKTHEKSVCFV